MIYQILTSRMPLSDLVLSLTALLVALVLGITVHEFAHAAMATWLGDPLPGRQGRLSLAPTAHLDVMGSLMFLVAGFGWGKPVQYNPYNLRAGPRSGPALVALAGPVSNIILAALFAIPVRLLSLLPVTASSQQFLTVALTFTYMIVNYNLILAVFNLIPVFPLDGFSVLLGILPADLAYQYEQTQRYGFFLLFMLLMAMYFVPVLNEILFGPVGALTHLFTGL